MSLINIVFVIINILGGYTVYKLMGLFCGVEMIKSKKALIVIYFVYYLLSCMNFMYINIPLVLLLFNLLMYFLISLNYSISIKKRIMAIFIMKKIYCFLDRELT